MSDVIERATKRRKIAENIIGSLRLLERWSRFGRPVIVGALAYDLVVAPDIDMEIYCPQLKIGHGFQILGECALLPGVTKASFANELENRDQGLYWQLHYKAGDGTEWKIDMWSVPENYPLPRSEQFIGPMVKALTTEMRITILELKEARMKDNSLKCLSIDLYRAVMDDGVHTPEQLREWLGQHDIGALTDWKPKYSL